MDVPIDCGTMPNRLSWPGTMTTNYHDSFITVSPDCPARRGETPPKPDSVAGLQLALLAARPYELTSDELLFEVHAARAGIADPDREAERAAFLAKSRACLRASPLVKQYGWGVHHDAHGRTAAYGVETEAYRALAARPDLKVVAGMRSRRG